MTLEHETLAFALNVAAEARRRYEHQATQPLEAATPVEYIHQTLADAMRAMAISKSSFHRNTETSSR